MHLMIFFLSHSNVDTNNAELPAMEDGCLGGGGGAGGAGGAGGGGAISKIGLNREWEEEEGSPE